jgi:hypothetical protein
MKGKKEKTYFLVVGTKKGRIRVYMVDVIFYPYMKTEE